MRKHKTKKCLLMAMALLMGLADIQASSLFTTEVQASNYSLRKSEMKSPFQMQMIADGTFSIYQSGDSVLMEIPMQLDGREIEIFGQVEDGFGLLNRPVQSLGVVCLSIPDSMTVEFRQPFYAERVLNERSHLLKPFLLSNGPVLGDVYHATSVSKNGNPIIDITDVVRGEKEWVENPQNGQIRSLLPEMGHLLEAHSLSQSSCVTKGEGVTMSILRYYEAESEQYAYNSMAILLPSGSKSLRMSIMVRLLPQQGMPIRLASRKVMAQTIRFKDYSQNPYTVVDDSLVVRWNPECDCICYVDDRVPSQYVDAFEKGVQTWNVLLRKAKVKFRLQVKILGRNSQRSQLGLNKERRLEQHFDKVSLPCLMSYDIADKGISSQKIVHPRTGEILAFRLNVGHDFNTPISPEELQKQIRAEIANLLGLRKGLSEYDAVRTLSYLYQGAKSADVYQDRASLQKIVY